MFSNLVNGSGDYHIGPFLRLTSILYLCYLSIYKNLRVPVIFFILYGIGSISFSLRLKNLLQSSKEKKSKYPIALWETYISFIVCMITVVMIW